MIGAAHHAQRHDLRGQPHRRFGQGVKATGGKLRAQRHIAQNAGRQTSGQRRRVVSRQNLVERRIGQAAGGRSEPATRSRPGSAMRG
jgi:hypothetical protein